jgi:CheY-like chemotaxis protein
MDIAFRRSREPSRMEGVPQVILVINTAPDTVDLLTRLFEQFNFLVVSLYTHDIRAGRVDVGALIDQHRPAIVVYDLAPPYLRNWQFCQHLRSTSLKGLPLVLTSTNTKLAVELLSLDRTVYEIQESTEALQRILEAVRHALAGK